jgi:rhodanese-related sulfurtransferase
MTFLRLFLLSLAIVFAVSPALADAGKLAALEDRLERRFDDVVHLTLDELALMQIDASAAPILIDVRPEREFAVSHLAGAIRIAPNASAKEVEDALKVIAVGRPVVFYCSVGYRSSRLAERAQERLSKAGIDEIYNLRGGVFAWHNKSWPLVNQDGATDYVHPYDRWRRKYIVRKALISSKPKGR